MKNNNKENEQRIKELERLIRLRSLVIKEAKKDIKKAHQEIDMIRGYKVLEKKKVRK